MAPKKAQKQQQQRKAPSSAKRNKGRKGANGVKGSGNYGVAALLQQIAKATIPKGSLENLGGRAGAAVGRGVASFMGAGDYVMNSIVSVDKIPSAKSGTARKLSHCEYIRDIVIPASPTAFTPFELALNPIDASTFPWLSQFAKLFTKYRFTQLLFEFRSSSSDYAVGGTLGTVVMTPLYNVDQPLFTSKQQMEASAHAISTKPSNSIICGFECSRDDSNFKWYNVRNSTTTITPYTDPGTFTYATTGLPGQIGTTLGELFVHYTIELIEPILASPSVGGKPGQVAVGKNTTTVAGDWDNYMFGLKPVAYTTSSGGINAADRMAVYSSNVKPQAGIPYDLCVPASEKNLDWYIRVPGTYELVVTCVWSTICATRTTGIPWNTVAATGVTIHDKEHNTSPDGKVTTMIWIINTTSEDARITWFKTATWTLTDGISSTTTLLFTRIS